MSKFHVQPVTLVHTASALMSLGVELTALTNAPSFSAQALGRGNVAPNVEEFLGEWGYTIGQLDDHLVSLANNLNKAAESYEMSELDIRNAGAV